MGEKVKLPGDRSGDRHMNSKQVNTHLHLHRRMHMYACKYTHTCACRCACVSVYVHAYVCASARVCVCECVCACVLMRAKRAKHANGGSERTRRTRSAEVDTATQRMCSRPALAEHRSNVKAVVPARPTCACLPGGPPLPRSTCVRTRALERFTGLPPFLGRRCTQTHMCACALLPDRVPQLLANLLPGLSLLERASLAATAAGLTLWDAAPTGWRRARSDSPNSQVDMKPMLGLLVE